MKMVNQYLIRDFITGFLDGEKVIGRPAAPLMLSDGSLIISDDYANQIYRVKKELYRT